MNSTISLTQLTRCGDFVITDYMIITSSLSSSSLDRIRAFASRSSVLWKQDFPKDEECLFPITKRMSGGGRGKRREQQKYILIVRANENGWCKRTVKYLYALAQ